MMKQGECGNLSFRHHSFKICMARRCTLSLFAVAAGLPTITRQRAADRPTGGPPCDALGWTAEERSGAGLVEFGRKG